MIDLTNLSNVVQIVVGLGAVLSAVYGIYYKWVIAPANKERATLIQNVKDLQAAVDLIKTDLKDSKKEFADDIQDLNTSLKKSDDDEQKEIDEVKQNLKELNADITDRLKTVDAKSERLLDLIIKYFTDKD